jgi:hypothetical protein
MFSQRQGYISVRIDGGQDIELSPVGDSPGNYRDQDGKPVYRVKGLGSEGQLFQLADGYLHVRWNPPTLQCTGEQLRSPGQCLLGYGDIAFGVQASANSSLNELRVTPYGLSAAGDVLRSEIDGTAYRAETADLDADGWPEVYVYVSSAGSGSYGSLVAYAVNKGKSATPIYLPPLEQAAGATAGYMGHDEFAVVENSLVRRFPVYRDGDTNAEASGGTRQIRYRLRAGEAGWVLAVDKIVEY